MPWSVKVIADSISPAGARLTTLECEYPRFIHSQVRTHRALSMNSQSCLSGDTEIYFDMPVSKRGTRRGHKIKLSDLWDKWNNGAKERRTGRSLMCVDLSWVDPKAVYRESEISKQYFACPTTLGGIRQKDSNYPGFKDDTGRWCIRGADLVNFFLDRKPKIDRQSLKSRIEGMHIRCLNEDTKEIITTNIVDVMKSGVKDVYEITLRSGKKLTCSADHRIYTKEGWKTLNDLGLLKNDAGFVSWRKDAIYVATNGQEKLDSPEWLREQREKGLTNGRIAEILGVSEDKVKKRMIKYGIRGYIGTILKGDKKRKSWNTNRTYRLPKKRQPNSKGKANPNWKGGYETYTDEKAAVSKFLSEHKKEILEKFGYKCQFSGATHDLRLHHIDPVWNNDERKFDKTNIIPLTLEVHNLIHKKHLDILFKDWVESGKNISEFPIFSLKKQNIDMVGKPRPPGNPLVCRWDKVVDVNYVGKKETYDIEVKGPYHNFIANGMVVHNSRAFPIEKVIAKVEDDPVFPLTYGKNRRGMKSTKEVADPFHCEVLWDSARKSAIEHAKPMAEAGLHKQWVNRILEPFSWIRTIISATEWSNFFALRLPHDAQPEIQKLAQMMKEAIDFSAPQMTHLHLPYIPAEERKQILKDGLEQEDWYGAMKETNTYLRTISSARCARVSYLTHDGTRDLDKDVNLGNKLRTDGHWSPLEHPATACQDKNERIGNFVGWKQYRKEFSNECR